MKRMVFVVMAFMLLYGGQVAWSQEEPVTVQGFLNRGQLYAQNEEYDKAIADFNESIRLNPNNLYAYLFRGVSYNLKGNFDQGIADLTQAIRLNPNYDELYFQRGAAYYQKGENDLAMADWEKTLRINPNHANARQYIEMLRQAR